jgi:hypothetical protein
MEVIMNSIKSMELGYSVIIVVLASPQPIEINGYCSSKCQI